MTLDVTSATDPSDRTPAASLEISALWLDSPQPVTRIPQGEPYQLAPGVTVSFLASAAEGLLEIDMAKAAAVWVDGRPTSEVATVHPGQIIMIGDSRLLLVRHFQAVVLPHKESYRRPKAVQNAVDAALQLIASPEVNSSLLSRQGRLRSLIAAPKQTLLLRGAVVCGAILVGVMALYSPRDEGRGQAAPGPAPAIAVAEKVAFGDLTGDAHSSTPPKAEESLAPAGSSATSPAKIETKGSSIKKVKSSSAKSASQPVSPSALSEKDRQMVIEYKLEARFDRSTARAKLRKLADSFPARSSARLEVERAYDEL